MAPQNGGTSERPPAPPGVGSTLATSPTRRQAWQWQRRWSSRSQTIDLQQGIFRQRMSGSQGQKEYREQLGTIA